MLLSAVGNGPSISGSCTIKGWDARQKAQRQIVRVSFIGHAAILIETRGVRILSDPWWSGPCFGSQWWIHPQPDLSFLEAAPPDFIYVSHGHSDHLHPGTLRRFPASTKILVNADVGIADDIRDLGFSVDEFPSGQVREIAPGVRIEITRTYSLDSMMIVDDGDEVCVNLNDAVHAAPQLNRNEIVAGLKDRYGRADYVFCGYGTASHFPNCYHIPGKDYEATAVLRQAYFNGVWASIIADLEPRFGFPFAADVVFFEDELMWANEPVHNGERPTARYTQDFPQSRTRVCDIAPGFVVENGRVIVERLFEPILNKALRSDRADDIATANKVTAPSREQVEELAELIRANVSQCRSYLAEYDGDYRFLIAVKSAPVAIEISKQGDAVAVGLVDEPVARSDYEVVFTTRFSYLRRALVTRFGHEVIFVGSGGTFTYREQKYAKRNLHREMLPLIRRLEQPPQSRWGSQPKWLCQIKRCVKRLIKREEQDLYDLAAWTVDKSGD